MERWVSDKARQRHQALHLECLLLRGAGNRSHHILGPQIVAKEERREGPLHLGRNRCSRGQRDKHNGALQSGGERQMLHIVTYVESKEAEFIEIRE